MVRSCPLLILLLHAAFEQILKYPPKIEHINTTHKTQGEKKKKSISCSNIKIRVNSQL